MPRHGHYRLWLVDTLARLCDDSLEPGSEAEPPALRGWRRTRLDVAPQTTRGIDWPQLSGVLTGAGAQARLDAREARGGAGGAAARRARRRRRRRGLRARDGLRTSGVGCSGSWRACERAASDAMLNATGVMELQARLYGSAGNAPPRELVVRALPRLLRSPSEGLLLLTPGRQAASSAAAVEPAAAAAAAAAG